MPKSKEFSLPPQITIRQVSSLKKELLNFLDANKSPWIINWSKCQQCDLSGLQLMVGLIKEGILRKGEVRFIGSLDPNLSQSLELADFVTVKGGKTFFFNQLGSGGVPCESR